MTSYVIASGMKLGTGYFPGIQWLCQIADRSPNYRKQEKSHPQVKSTGISCLLSLFARLVLRTAVMTGSTCARTAGAL